MKFESKVYREIEKTESPRGQKRPNPLLIPGIELVTSQTFQEVRGGDQPHYSAKNSAFGGQSGKGAPWTFSQGGAHSLAHQSGVLNSGGQGVVRRLGGQGAL